METVVGCSLGLVQLHLVEEGLYMFLLALATAALEANSFCPLVRRRQ
jgi:hypothetical protein